MVENVAILGAGVTGLSAAYKIRETNPDTHLLVADRDDEMGGMAKTIRWQGCKLDLGPHRFYTEIPGIEQFVRNLCGNRFVPVQRRSRMYLRGKFLRYPVNPVEIMKLLGLRSSISIAFSSAATLLPRFGTVATTYQDYICSRFGKKLYEILFGPYAQKVWGRDPTRLEAETAIVRLRGDSIWQTILDTLSGKGTTYVRQFLYPTGGIGQIAAQLARAVRTDEILLGAGEAHPVLENGRCIGIQGGTLGFRPAEAVLSTIPLPALAGSLFPLDSPPHQASAELRFRALVLLFLLYDAELPIDDTWLYFPESEIPFTRLYIPKNFHPDSVPEGKSVLCLEFPCEREDDIFRAEESVLRAHANQHLRSMGLTGLDAAAGWTVRLSEGYPIYSVGYRDHLSVILNALRRLPNLVTAGRQGLFRHNNLDQAIEMGLLAGEHLCRFTSESGRWYDRISRFEGYRIVD